MITYIFKHKKIILVGSVVLFILIYFTIGYRLHRDIPTDVLSNADVLWNEQMLKGVGASYSDGKRKPAVSNSEVLYRENPREAIYDKSGILIKSQLYNGYMYIEGGAIDIIKGPIYDYELYGRVVGQHHIYHRFAWNDHYHYSHSDYYLVKRNNDTNTAILVKQWNRSQAQYGSLQYDDSNNILHVKLCGAINDTVIPDVELYKDEKMTFIQCTK